MIESYFTYSILSKQCREVEILHNISSTSFQRAADQCLYTRGVIQGDKLELMQRTKQQTFTL